VQRWSALRGIMNGPDGKAIDAELTLRELAGKYRPELAQGAVFAATTRVTTDLVTSHTELAVKNHCEMTVEQAAAVAPIAAGGSVAVSPGVIST